MRLLVDDFKPSKSQRHCQRQNSDITMSINDQLAEPDALELYARYQVEWHAAPQRPDITDIRAFLAESAVETILMLYRQEEKLLGAGWVDILDQGISSVYFAFNATEAKRRLGVYSLLVEIELARKLGKPWLWLGFMVPGSSTMAYKRDWAPHELLVDGVWQSQPSDAVIADLVAANPGQPSTS